MKEFYVKCIAESWDYDVPDGMPPLCNEDMYAVMLGNEKITTFTDKEKAEVKADELNKAVSLSV